MGFEIKNNRIFINTPDQFDQNGLALQSKKSHVKNKILRYVLGFFASVFESVMITAKILSILTNAFSPLKHLKQMWRAKRSTSKKRTT